MAMIEHGGRGKMSGMPAKPARPARPGMRELREMSAMISLPDDIRAEVDLRLGPYIDYSARARITPFGVICAGLAATAIILAAGAVATSVRRRGGS